MASQPIFAGRGQELRRLAACLDRSLSGRGQVCVLTGEPGAGKTALAAEFARLAQAARPDLIFVASACLPFYGPRVPFHPFRSLLQRLTGVGPQRTAAEVNSARLRRLVEHATAIVLDWGRDLFEVFLAPMPAAAAGDPLWQPLPAVLLFQQYANVLHRLSQKTPLVVLVDDLQWADRSSVALLEHLLPRLASSRILLLLAHTQGAQPEAGEAYETLNALLAQSSDEVIDLARSDGRAWIDAYLEQIPSRLDADFRKGLYRQTAGNPLAVGELIRLMEDAGALAPDDYGVRAPRRPIFWREWPGRATGVAQAVLDRLPAPVLETLQAAAAQGLTFVAEAVAQAQGADLPAVLAHLSHPLVQRHGLVRSVVRGRVNGRKLHHWAFAHPLYLHLLYHQAPIAHRNGLHARTAAALEAILGPEADAVEHGAVLAWHWERAGQPEAARPLWERLGAQAAAWSAWPEAEASLSQALACASDSRQRFSILLAREAVRRCAGDDRGRQADLAALTALAADADHAGPQVAVHLRRAQAAVEAGDHAQGLAEAAAALECLEAVPEAGSALRRGAAQRWLGEALLGQGDLAAADEALSAALATAQEAGHQRLQADTLRSLAVCRLRQGRLEESRGCYEQAVWLCHAAGDRVGEAAARHGRALALLHQGRIDAACDAHAKALAFARRSGNQRAELFALLSLASLNLALGRWAQAADESEAAQAVAEQIGEDRLTAHALALQSVARRHLQGNAAAAVAAAQRALDLAGQLGDWSAQRAAQLALADALAAGGQHLQALAAYWQALDTAHAMQDEELALFALSGLAELALAAGADHLAAARAQEIHRRLAAKPAVSLDTIARPALAAFRGLRASDPAAAAALLQDAHRRLQAVAERIVDEDLRRSYLTALPAHRELLALVASTAPATIAVADLPQLEQTVRGISAAEPGAPRSAPAPLRRRGPLPWWRRHGLFPRRAAEAAAAAAALAFWLSRASQ
ncbi:MAG: AAA family ATPase [Anaerolineae bacterium]|nr:AAA family ATPase [Anaerolineae bacterium]